jgi:hypothetical protein
LKNRQRKRYIDGDIQDEIEAKALDGWGPSQIFRHLEKKLEADVKHRYPPNVRTIQRIVQDMVVPDTTGEWSITDNEGADARLVLDIMAANIVSKQGFMYPDMKRKFTKGEAQWIIRVRKAAPDAPAKIIWTLAQLYIRKERKGITDTADLDGYLAFTPWRDKDCFRLYKRVVAKGWMPKVPLWFSMVDTLCSPGPFDPRFTESENDIREFEKDICEKTKKGISPKDIAVIYKMHPEDVEDIIHKQKGGKSK